MFGPRGSKLHDEDIGETAGTVETNVSTRTPSPEPISRPPSPTVAPRRVIVESLGGRRVATNEMSTERKLTVGRGISLVGEIACCDLLVVEGNVEAKLTDGKLLEITDAGQFRGSVETENADIAGNFDGQLIVHGRLTVRSTGRISGSVKYGELDINAGGQIIGEIQIFGSQESTVNGLKTVTKISPLLEHDEKENAKTDRRKLA